MALYSAANHLIDNLGLDHLNSININIPVYCTGAGTAAPSSSSSSGLATSKASTSTSTMHNHHTNQSQNVYPTSYYNSHPNANTNKASTSTSSAVSSTSWRDTSTGAGSSRGVNGASSGSGSGTTTTAGVNVTPLTPPMTSTFTSRTTPGAGSTSDSHYGQHHHHHHHHHHQQQQQPRLPSIAQLERGPETQPHYPRVSHRQYAYSNPSQHQSSGYQSQRQTYLVSQGYLQPQQPQQHQHLPPLTPPDDIPNHIPHREQTSFSQSSPSRPSSSSAAFVCPLVEESDEEEETAEEEDENMQVAEESESEEEEDVFMDASSAARTRRRDSPPSIAHETIPPSSIYTSTSNGTLRAALSTPPNYHPSYAPAPPPLSDSPVDTYAPPPTTAAPSSSSHPSYPIDWLDFTRTRSAHFIAEKTCEMICYLWFSSPPADAVDNEDDSTIMKKGAGKEEVSLTSPMKSTFSSSNPPAKRPFSSTSPPSSLQLRTTPTFVSFMQKLLETTQVSQSVIVLSLHFIYRLKERNRFTPAQKGSEFRIGVAGLMMANKFLDDNTYTNKTWSEVSGIELEEINRMEREFLLGVDFNLYVDKPTYEAWLNLLKGLVWAKERDCRRVTNGVGRGRHQQQHVRGRERERAGEKPIAKKGYTTTGSTGPSSRVFTTPSAATATTKQTGRTGNPYPPTYRSPPRVRARSSSPTARSSVQSQTSYSSRKDYWAPEQQQTYVYAPNNAAVAASTTSASDYANTEYAANSTPPSSMDLGAYTRVAPTTTYPTTSESRSAQESTSPALPVFSYAPSNSYTAPAASSAYTHQQHSQSRPSSKRTADNAFSPTSTASFALAQPSKRPVSMGGLSMNMNVGSSGSHSTGTSPLDGLQSFSRMSLGMGGSPSEGTHEREREREKERERVEREREAEAERERERERQKARPPPVTLSTAYSYDSHGKSPRVPQNLYFYTLACSPLKKDEVSSTSPASPSPSPFAQQPRYHSQPEGNAQTHVYPRAGQRKARLRYHQPSLSSSSSTAYEYADLNATARPVYPPPSTTSAARYDSQGYHVAQPQAQVQPQLPRLVMPGSTSRAIGSSTTRYLSAANANSGASTTTSTNTHTAALPHFRDDVWAMPPAPAYTCPPAPPAPKEGPMVYKQEEDMEEASYSDSTAEVYPSASTHNIPSAPFANAGPPGVSFSYYPEADANDSSSPSPVTLRGNMTDATRLGSGNNIHRVGMMDDYLSSRRASASGVAGLSGYSSRGYPSASTLSYPDYRAGYSTANPTLSATTRSTSQNPPHAHVSGHGYTSGSYSTYASPVAYHSSTSTLPATGGYTSGNGGYTSSTTGNGGYPSGTYSAYASPHAGYGGGGVER